MPAPRDSGKFPKNILTFFQKPLAFFEKVWYNTPCCEPTQGYSSAGRVPVSKTVGRGFESSCPCQTKHHRFSVVFLFGTRFEARHAFKLQATISFLLSWCSLMPSLLGGVQNPPAPAKSLGRFRSDREKTRKAEISKDFSAFFAPNFFQISIDPFSIFLRVEGFELPKTHFFMN